MKAEGNPQIKTERINGQDLRVMSIEEVCRAIFDKSAEEAAKLKLVKLSVAKFMLPWGMVYRLTWSARGRAYLAAENTAEFRTRGRAIAGGTELAAQKGVEFTE